MGTMFKISWGLFAVLWLSGCSGFGAPTVEGVSPTSTQAPMTTQTITETAQPTWTPTMTSASVQIKTVDQRPRPSATATVELPVVLGTPFPTPATPITIENVTNLRELAVFGSPVTYEAALSADGKWFFLARSNGIEIYDPGTNRQMTRLDLIVRDEPSSSDLAVSVDGSMVLGVTRADIQVWDANGGRMIWQNPQSLSPYGSIALSPDSHLAAIADCVALDQCTFQVFRLADGTVVFSGKGTRPLFSPDGRWFAADVERSLWIWDIASWSKVQHIWLENPAETTRTFSPDGELLAVGRSDKVEIWRIAGRKLIRAIDGFTPLEYAGLPVSFSTDSTHIAVQDGIRQWQVFEIATGMNLPVIELPESSIAYWDNEQLKGYPIPAAPNYFPPWNAKAFRFVDRDSALAFPYFQPMDDGTVSSEVCRLSLAGEMACVPTEKSLADIDLETLSSHVGGSRPIEVVSVLQDGAYLIYDASLKVGAKAGLWDRQHERAKTWNRLLTQWSTPKDENRVAVALRDNGVYHVEVFDLVSWKSIYRKDFKTFWLVLDLSLDGNQLVVVESAGDVDQLQVVDLDTGKLTNTIDIPKPDDGDVFVSAVEFGSAGDILALAYSDGKVEVYDPEGKLLYDWQAHQGEIVLAFSQDGRLLATSSRDGLIKIWGVAP